MNSLLWSCNYFYIVTLSHSGTRLWSLMRCDVEVVLWDFGECCIIALICSPLCVSYSVVNHFYHALIRWLVLAFWSSMAALSVGSAGALLLCHTVGTVVLNTCSRRRERNETMTITSVWWTWWRIPKRQASYYIRSFCLCVCVRVFFCKRPEWIICYTNRIRFL